MFRRICFLSFVMFFAVISQSNAATNEIISESMLQNSSETKILEYIQQNVVNGGSFNLLHRYLDSKTVLHYAAMRDFGNLIKIFVEAKCPVDARDRKGYTPLMYAVASGNMDAIEVLVSLQADILVLTPKNSTLFNLAQENCCEHVCDGIKNLLDGTWDRDTFVKFLVHYKESEPFIQIIESFLGQTLESFAAENN